MKLKQPRLSRAAPQNLSSMTNFDIARILPVLQATRQQLAELESNLVIDSETEPEEGAFLSMSRAEAEELVLWATNAELIADELEKRMALDRDMMPQVVLRCMKKLNS